MSERVTSKADGKILSNEQMLRRILGTHSEAAAVWNATGNGGRETLEIYAHSLGKHNYEDIGRYAIQGLLATPTYYNAVRSAELKRIREERNFAPNSLGQAMAHVAFRHTAFPHHPFDDLDIRRKIIVQRDAENVPTMVLPGETQREYLTQEDSDPTVLRNPNMWVVSTASLASFHERLKPYMVNGAPTGVVTVDGEPTSVTLPNFGQDEMDTLYWAGVLGNREWRAPYSREEAEAAIGSQRVNAWRDAA